METIKNHHKLGAEYIVEVTHNEFYNSKPYFVCLLCESSGENLKDLPKHMTSTSHQLKFIVRFSDTSLPGTFH